MSSLISQLTVHYFLLNKKCCFQSFRCNGSGCSLCSKFRWLPFCSKFKSEKLFYVFNCAWITIYASLFSRCLFSCVLHTSPRWNLIRELWDQIFCLKKVWRLFGRFFWNPDDNLLKKLIGLQPVPIRAANFEHW